VLLVEGEEPLERLAEVRDRLGGLKRIVTVKPVTKGNDPLVASWTVWMAPHPATDAPVRVDPATLATIVYTSGTTGRSKGVMLSHRNMLQNVRSALAVYDVYTDDTFLSFLPLSHMLERTVGYYLTMVAGARVVFARSVGQLAEDFLSMRPTVIVAVPRIFERLHGAVQASLESASPTKRRLFELAHRVGWDIFEWRQGRGEWQFAFVAWPLLRTLVAAKLLQRMGGRLRLCISGGAALNPQIARTFIGLGLPICQGYGLTEASPVVSVNHLDRNDPASIGLPLPGVEVAFGDDNVLLVKGPNVMLGYWNNPEATAQVKSATGWLNTGDQARMENGFLYIIGRIKEIIVLGNGEKVPPGDMELAILLDPLFEQVMVVGEGKPFLSALVVLNGDQAAKAGNPDDKAVLKSIAAQLNSFPGYAQVRRAVIVREPWSVDNGLMTPTLKLRRNQILERYGNAVEEVYRRH
jgi:long-chain acyl-CoA synthetase